MTIDNPAAIGLFITEDVYCIGDDNVSVTDAVVDVKPLTVTPPIETAAPIAISYMGKNTGAFTILCHYTDTDYMDDKHLEALKSTLQRKGLSLDHVALLNIAKHPNITLGDVMREIKPALLLILGQEAMVRDLPPQPLNTLNTTKGIKMLYTHSFAEMMGDRDRTKAFWEQMKIM